MAPNICTWWRCTSRKRSGRKRSSRLSQNLRCGTPEDLLSRGIEQNHSLVLVHRDDGVHRIVNQRCEPLFLNTQRLFGLLARGNVAAHCGEADRAVGGILDVEDVVDHPERFTGLEMAEPDFHFGTALTEHAREEFLDDEALIFGEEELLDVRS